MNLRSLYIHPEAFWQRDAGASTCWTDGTLLFSAMIGRGLPCANCTAQCHLQRHHGTSHSLACSCARRSLCRCSCSHAVALVICHMLGQETVELSHQEQCRTGQAPQSGSSWAVSAEEQRRSESKMPQAHDCSRWGQATSSAGRNDRSEWDSRLGGSHGRYQQ